MIGIDTNVLVRYIVQDDPRQSRSATRFIESSCTNDTQGLISHIVLCEFVWVLATAYGYERRDIVRVLEQLLRIAQFRIVDPQIVWRAFRDYRDHGADFSDHLIGRLHAALGCERTVTFDRAAAAADGFELLR